MTDCLNWPATVTRWSHMVSTGSGWGSVWFLLLWRSGCLVWVIFLMKMNTWEQNEENEGNEDVVSQFEGLTSYLKHRPVHVHPWAVVVAEPFQVLLCVCSQDRALQFSVYCGIAEGEESGTQWQWKCQKGHRGVPIWQQNQQCSSNSGAERDPVGSWQECSVSLNINAGIPNGGSIWPE